MSYWMADFNQDGVRYELLHLNSDDSRVVIAYSDPTTVLVRFDSSLKVLRNGEQVGCLNSYPDETWFFERQDGTTTNLGVPVNDYHWNNIVKAEVEVAKLLIGTTLNQARFTPLISDKGLGKIMLAVIPEQGPMQ
jgi:hypothetical protein